MHRVGIVAAFAVAVAGCATPVILENPATKQRVNCTFEADRLAYDATMSDTGAQVPRPRYGPPTVQAFDLEQQCMGTLLSEGFICVTGCTTPPR